MTISNLDITALPRDLAAQTVEPVRATSELAEGRLVRSTQRVEKLEATAEPSRELLSENVQQLNSGLKSFGLEFELSEIDNRVIARVVDRNTGELIRQIPSEELLRMAQSMEKPHGLLLQATA